MGRTFGWFARGKEREFGVRKDIQVLECHRLNCVPQNLCFEVLTSSTSEYDLI